MPGERGRFAFTLFEAVLCVEAAPPPTEMFAAYILIKYICADELKSYLDVAMFKENAQLTSSPAAWEQG